MGIATLDVNEREAFLQRYYAAEEPAVLRKVATTQQTAEAICSELNARIARDPTASMQYLCWDVRPEVVSELCTMPSLIGEVLNRQNAFLRENHVRVWFNLKGHRTPWHYDGHSLHIFNLQLKGRKRWRLVAPETPLLCIPFTSVCLFGDYSLARRRHYEFETGEGDLVFVPRYWYHSVESLGDLNINLNWVLTPKTVPADNPTARREVELTWLKARIRPLLSESTRKYNVEYAGAGKPAIELLTSRVSIWAGLARGLKETSKVPLMLPGVVSQGSNLRAARRSKRVLRSLVNAEQDTTLGSSSGSTKS